MPARRKPKKHFRADAFRAQDQERQQARRDMCSWLKFWKACGHKKCLRAQACVADAFDCFDRFWPTVPEWLKVCIRAAGKARRARLSPPDVKAEIKRELARWRAFVASRAAPQEPPAGQIPPRAPEPPQSASIMRAPSGSGAPSPRLRVL